jgi:hypothetical protein
MARGLVFVLVVALCLGCACRRSTQRDAGGAGRESSEMWGDRFPAYSGAREVGKEHVSGANMHILCSAYATSARTEDVVAFYAARFSDAQRETARRITVRAKDEHVLEVKGVDDAEGPRCGARLTGEDKTIIVVSQAVK